MTPTIRLFAHAAIFASLVTPLFAQSSQELAFFEQRIRPALIKYCYECHSQEEKSSRGGLLVDTRQAILQGGDSGPAAIPGDVEGSIFWDAIMWQHGYEMPPDDPMPDQVIADFKKWIEMGLPDPREREVADFASFITEKDIEEAKNEHWAFQLPRRLKDASIDKIIDHQLKKEGVQPNQRADSYTLLRRINFDLIGLPPTIAEIEAFQSAWSRNPNSAIQQKVEELLARPQFGERWGRHWMDVVRFSESSGSRSVNYPNAWRYRDYIIDSFNEDKPYNRFVQEQIAGDLLKAPTDEAWQENLIATGFLAIGLKHHDEKNPRQFESDMVDEQINTLTQGFLGLTVGCARCHDHKYDPIPTNDYYALAGIFHSTQTFYGAIRAAQIHRASPLLLLPIPDDVSAVNENRLRDADQLRGQLARLKEQMAGMPRGSKGNPAEGKERRHMQSEINRIQAQLNFLNPDGSPKTFAMGVQDSGAMVNASILLGGELERPAQEVPRGFLQVLGDLNFEVDSNKDSGRLQLAQAMTTPRNPLIHRVMVNRVWQHLMGRPIVSTPNNFGLSGMKPENQQLLDYLAVSFVDKGWSMKQLIHEIVLSQAYQRSSAFDEKNYGADPDNKLLWRANARPLTAEALRDATLALSGEIDLERPLGSAIAAGGAGRGGGSVDFAAYRSVYLPVVRDKADEMLGVFDFADANVTTAVRSQSIVPTQALYMMNSDFITERSHAMAGLLTKNFRSTSDRIENAFLLAYGRPATSGELMASSEFFTEFKSSGSTNRPTSSDRSKGKSKGGKGGKGAAGSSSSASILPADQELAVFCQTLMSSARFRILN